jgi:hypothetical protein
MTDDRISRIVDNLLSLSGAERDAAIARLSKEDHDAAREVARATTVRARELLDALGGGREEGV